ncbi:MAG: saccharopine dehydrogenase NADP-binding domain-containing protein [Pseudomonadota bacterium]
MADNWLIYGAYGYTGKLIVQEARSRDLQPLISGRSAGPLTRLAGDTGCKQLVVDLDERERLRRHLNDVSVVLNCAGPFAHTAQPLIDACLDTHTHYLDITGEIDVFEYAQSRHHAAKTSGIVLCPGVGFDVVPTDCLAATLKHAMEDATHLALGFDANTVLSPGTAKTTVATLPNGGRVRQEGELIEVPLAYRDRQIDFGNGNKSAMTIPWGDVATAYHTTGIGSIETYIPASESLIKRLRRLDAFRGALGWRWVQRMLHKEIDKRVHGPTEHQRETDRTYVWGEVRNAEGSVRSARLVTANAYAFTVEAAIAASRHLLERADLSGAYTPSTLLGSTFASQLPGSSNIVIT